MTTPASTSSAASGVTSLAPADQHLEDVTTGSLPDGPSWLPDEATLNRLAGEFFSALPGLSSPAPGSPVPVAEPGGIEHAPRVDVSARSKDIPAVPGDSGGSTAVTPVPPPAVPDVPGLQVDDPAAAGFAPGRAVPDAGEAATAVLGAAGLGVTVPEGPIVPGLTGLQLGDPGQLTPGAAGLAAPRPDQPAPGLDSTAGALTAPGGAPDVTAAVPVRGGFGAPAAPPDRVGAPFEVTGLQVPLPGGEQLPPLSGLSAPLPSAGAPGVPASDQVIAGAGLPGGPPDVTAASALITGAELGPLPPGLAATPDQPPAVPSAPGLPVDATEGVSQLPVAAPFTPTAGLRAPGVPAVPTLPAESAGAVPAAGSTPQTTAGSPAFGGGDINLGVPADPGLPSVPQPPLPVPDPPAPVPTPSTPYYFLAESSPYRGGLDSAGGGDLDSLATAALHPLAVDPAQVGVPTLGVPGSDLFDTAPAAPTAGSVPSAASSPAFYFTDRVDPTLDRSLGATRAAAPQLGADPHPPFDVRLVRRDFPILAERVNGHQLVWFDNAATTQKPQAVIDRLAHFYRHENSNIHRAAHELAARATDAYEGARKTVARFIGAESEKNIVFVRGATEAINLVAKSWGKANIHRGDEIIISHLEHHANIVPWQQLIAETGAKLRVIPVDDSGQLLLQEYSRLLSEKTKLVAVTQVSNALGTVTPVDAVVEMAHRAGACVLIDGAQSVPHVRVNMQALGADFFVFSGHKIYGPTGIGVVYGRAEVLESMPPWEGGGNMIADVTFEKTVFQHPPNRFEAGTGNIADAVGLGTALDYVTRIGLDTIARYEHQLLEYATPRMQAVPGLHMIGTARDKASVLSFVLDGYRTEEVGAALNQKGIAVRSGHHCAQPILRRFGLEATVRPSVAFYNTTEEIDRLLAVLHRLAADRGRR
ncbi:MAG TPA: family 2A encapsulin nanocompartment cargo protein cysteine desulfurase [Nakamurella sp.]